MYVSYQVTSPDDCPGEDPYIPGGFRDENTLPEWKSAGAAWKECYDGYRCEAWWGSMSGQPQGAPVVLNAPLDWPDCCALCSNADGDDMATAGCAGWSFHPSTGSCQLLVTVSLDDNVSTSWGVNRTVHGYPGYLESPVSGCWAGGKHDLCSNVTFYLLCWGACLGFIGLVISWYFMIHTPSTKQRLLVELIRDRQSFQLKKAACVEVSMGQLRLSKGTHPSSYTNVFEGAFLTQDNAVFVVPELLEGEAATSPGLSMEQDMLRVLFSERLTPLADWGVAYRCRTTQGLKSEFDTLRSKAQPGLDEVATPTIGRSEQDARSSGFDCLLLVGRPRSYGHDGPGRKVGQYCDIGSLGESVVGGEGLGYCRVLVFVRGRRVLQACYCFVFSMPDLQMRLLF